MEFGSLDGGDVDEYNGVRFVKISKMFVMEDDSVYAVASFDRVYNSNMKDNGNMEKYLLCPTTPSLCTMICIPYNMHPEY